MKISVLCATGSLLVSTATSATGVIPVLDLDFTRPAADTLKKIGINDACIVAASNPAAFTYCREGSSTLWKYQALDLEQQASILKGEHRAATDYGRITIVEVDSPACEEDTPAPLIKPAITHGLALGAILLFLLIGFRYAYRAIMPHRPDHAVLSDLSLQRLNGYLPAKALGAFGIAAAVALVYCVW
ncbi:hypothetical protein DJ564_22160 [Pseudomonas sp. 31-12]|uniref:hypothetical protein n=1 Tax=Pseudomonas sp. 31-12 TaxID=2201356 RepID=UPI000D6CBB1C|nr:hypothetical protein [Pseudomonas sp. 31-12]AWM93291.1 hypothetical protein DJ564_22160 [Pseudomonas sp. 31-12]